MQLLQSGNSRACLTKVTQWIVVTHRWEWGGKKVCFVNIIQTDRDSDRIHHSGKNAGLWIVSPVSRYCDNLLSTVWVMGSLLPWDYNLDFSSSSSSLCSFKKFVLNYLIINIYCKIRCLPSCHGQKMNITRPEQLTDHPSEYFRCQNF